LPEHFAGMFPKRFCGVCPMSEDWNVYRTRFLVRARQLAEALSFTDPLGREHHGRPGDYLVQFSNDQVRIAPREVFEDVYVPMSSENGPSAALTNQAKTSAQSVPI